MPTERDRVTLKIPRPLYESLRKVIASSGFGSVNEFVVYVLRDIASARVPPKAGPAATRARPAKAAARPDVDESGLTPDEVRVIKERLRNLGYL